MIELDRAKCDTAGAQGRQYLVQIRTLANEHRDRFSSACERTMDSRNDCGRFPDGIGAEIELITASEINEAYERVTASDVRYRFVIDTATI